MVKFFDSLGIDLIYLLIQFFNFFLVFLILYKFLSKPLSKIIQEREEKINKGIKLINEAEDIIKKAKKIRNKIISKTKRERIEMLNKIQEERSRLLKKIYKEVEEEKIKNLERIKQEEELMEKMIAEKMKKISFDIFYELAKKFFHHKDLDQKFIENLLRKNND